MTTSPDFEPLARAAAVREDAAMGFVGVSTGQSSIMTVFPRWAQLLGLGTDRLVGWDLALDTTDDRYRAVVHEIRDDASVRGALVTTHKLGIYRSARDMFDTMDEFAELCREVSSISKRNNQMHGHAKDPISAGHALEGVLAPEHFGESGGHAVLLGAGGAGTAISWYLATRQDRPAAHHLLRRRRTSSRCASSGARTRRAPDWAGPVPPAR